MMAQDERSSSALMRNLQDALGREPAAAPAMAAPTYNRLRLQPVVVPEPRFTSAGVAQGQYGAANLPPISADDDLPMEDVMDDQGRKRWSSLLLASSVIIAGAAAVAAFIFFLSPPERVSGPAPEIKADPTSMTKGTEEAAAAMSSGIKAPAAEPVAVSPAPSEPVSMGQVSTELVAPTTDGLSPARKIGSIRIMVEGDREILAPKP